MELSKRPIYQKFQLLALAEIAPALMSKRWPFPSDLSQWIPFTMMWSNLLTTLLLAGLMLRRERRSIRAVPSKWTVVEGLLASLLGALLLAGQTALNVWVLCIQVQLGGYWVVWGAIFFVAKIVLYVIYIKQHQPPPFGKWRA